jgi:hypothetical protein
MIFVGLGLEWELEQLRVLGALAFHTGTFMLLVPDVDTEKALHSRSHVAYQLLHRLKTVFHNVFILKQCLSTHDDMQGANKVQKRCAVSKRVGSTGQLSNYREKQDQQADRRTCAHTHTTRLIKL